MPRPNWHLLTMGLIAVSCTAADDGVEEGAPVLAAGVTAEDLEARVAQFEVAALDFDADVLAPWERSVLAKLVEASDVMQAIFAEQVSRQNAEWAARLAAYSGPGAAAARTYFEIMAGPWDRLEHDAPFLAAGPKPPGAGYYPADITKEEFDAWIAAHPADREAFEGYFTVIRREGDSLVAVPYSEAYRDKLEQAAALLRDAATVAENASLADYLRKRADAFLSNDYFSSDLAWMDMDSRIEPTIGPYEVYEDVLLGYKAAFESFVTVADSAASAELQLLKDWLPRLERRLPVEDRYRNPDRAFESPIRVVDQVYAAGDTRAGVQTTAFNLPNDVRVHEQKGSKKVMLRNVSRAKFDRILAPIAQAVLAPDLAGQVTFRPWFTNVVMHELAHGLGPGTITLASGETTTVNRALRDHYSGLEELKADVTGLHNLTVLRDEGVYTDEFVRQAFSGHLADLFRAVRFGAGEAHGRANLIQFNWLRERGALTTAGGPGGDGPATAGGPHFTADLDAIIAANRDLATEVLTIQATGDYARAAAFIQRYGTIPEEMQATLDRLAEIPVDIRPQFAVLQKMRTWQ
ncbi:MAG: dipeptidyl-peptidase 3 family protein [Longimicrobiales bacterium]